MNKKDLEQKTHAQHINNLMNLLFREMVSAIRSLLTVNGLTECPMRLLHRYIDHDREQSIYRVKKVYIDDHKQLNVVYDANTGENFAADVFFDHDDDFDGEDTYCLSARNKTCLFDIDMVHDIYTSLRDIDLPRRLLEIEKEKHLRLYKDFQDRWNGSNVDLMGVDELRRYKNECFELYEKTGFLYYFDSPYDDKSDNHNGKPFKVVRRATENECDLEALPLWLVRFGDGSESLCYPEEITKLEKELKR